MDDIEIGLELAGAGVGFGFADRRSRGFDIEPQGGRGKPCVNAGDGQPIGLAASMLGRDLLSGERSASARRSLDLGILVRSIGRISLGMRP